jgi:hypothetical protein
MPTLWYFAYGSNMQSATLRGRRGVDYRRAVPVKARGWRLVFDKPPLLPAAGAVANIVPEAGAETPGVAFEIAEDDLAHVELTEGVLIGNYARVDVDVEWLEPRQPRGGQEGGQARGGDPAPGDHPRRRLDVPAPAIWRAVSLSSGRRDPSLRPSERYMALVIAGAIEHGLPAAHVAFLRGVPAAADSPEAQAVRSLIDDALKRRR